MFRANIRVSPDTAKLHGLDEDWKCQEMCSRETPKI